MKGGGVSANMDAFMELIKNTTNDKLAGLVQKYVPPMCTTEISTRGILNVFLQEIQKIYNPILASLQNAESSGNFPPVDILTLQKIIIVVGHIAKVVPWKKPYGDCITAIFNTLIIPVLKLKSSSSHETVDLKLEAFETITKFLEIYEMQTNPFLPLILPFLEAHFQDVLDNKTKKSKEASDLLGMMLQSTSKLFIPSSLVSLLKVSIVLFFSHEDPTSKIEQLDVIGHIVKKLLNITKSSSSSLSSLSSPSHSLSSPSPSLSSPASSLSPSSSSSPSPVPSLPLSSLSPASSSSLASLISPRDPEFDLQTAIHDFPYEEINHVSNFLATKILVDYTNLDFWFESSVMALALFSGISARAGNLNEHKNILDMTCSTYLELLVKIKHSTKSERQFSVIFMQALSLCVDLSDRTALQPYLSNFYSELRKLNLSTKVPADSKPMRLYFQKLRSLIIRAIASVIKAFEDFTPLADQFLRETAKELADPLILADFVEALGPHTSEYLPRVMKPLFQQLTKETVSLKLKQVIIDTITRIIKLTQKEFLPFLQECAEILRPLASFSLVTDSCLPFVSLYSTILVSFCEYPQIDGYIPLILPIFLDILNQDISVQDMGSVNNANAKEGANDETEAMDLSPLTICEVLSNLKTIFASPQLSKKVLSVSPTFLPELLIYLMDHIPTEIIFEEDSFIRVAQLEFIQQLLETESKEDLLGLLPLVSHILQNIEMNTNEIDVQVTSFDTLAHFISKLEDNISEETRNRVKQVCEGSKFLADDQRELKMSIERVILSIEKLEHK